jgi:chromate transporter
MRPAMRGIGPAVIGVLAVSLVQLAPHAVPDPFAMATLMATVAVLLLWRVGTVKLMLAGAVLGILRSRLFPLRGVKAALEIGLGAKV